MAPAVAERSIAVNLVMLGLKELKPSPLNPRKHFDQTKLEELAATMGNGRGVIEPLIARKVNGYYDVIAGARRLRAAAIAQLEEVPVIVKDLTDAEVLETMVVENDAREDMTPLERADGYRRLLKLGTLDVKKLALRISRSSSWVYDVLKLDELIPEAKALLEDGRITMGHAVLLTRLTAADQKRAIDPNQGGMFAHESTRGLFVDGEEPAAAKGDKYHGRRAVSVRELESWINETIKLDLKHPQLEALFPETAAILDEAESVVHITYEHYLYGAKAKGSVALRSDWQRADGLKGSKTCDHAITGVVVIGPGRGEAFKVCVTKDCAVHFPKKKSTSTTTAATSSPAARKTDDAYRKRQLAAQKRQKVAQERQAATAQRWKAAVPAIITAVAGRLKQVKLSALVEIISRNFQNQELKTATKAVGKIKTADDALRLFAYIEMAGVLANEWVGPRDFPKIAKLIGLDLKPLLKVQPTGKAKTPAKAAKKRGARA